MAMFTLVDHAGHRSPREKPDSRADMVLRPVGDAIRVQAWIAAAAKSFYYLCTMSVSRSKVCWR